MKKDNPYMKQINTKENVWKTAVLLKHLSAQSIELLAMVWTKVSDLQIHKTMNHSNSANFSIYLCHEMFLTEYYKTNNSYSYLNVSFHLSSIPFFANAFLMWWKVWREML